MNTISWSDFYKDYLLFSEYHQGYRLGQAFINTFIKDDGCEICEGLWQKTGEAAKAQIADIIWGYQWDWNALPLVNRGEEL